MLVQYKKKRNYVLSLKFSTNIHVTKAYLYKILKQDFFGIK